MPEGHGHSPLDHVIDHTTLDLPGLEIPLPRIQIGDFGFQITRFMVVEVVAAVLIVLVIVGIMVQSAMFARRRAL